MPELPTARLGDTGLEVTRLGFGAMEIRGVQRGSDVPRGRDVTPAQVERILNAVLDSGINYIDTSMDYGMSEEFIGRFISHRRDEYFLASKCGCPVGQDSQHVFTRENIIAGVEQSLTRMKTDYLDVAQFHQSPSDQTLAENESVEALRELQQAGKIGHLGMSGLLPNLPGQIKMGVFQVMQIPYSALERRHELWISEAAAAGSGTVVRGGVAKGDPESSGAPNPDTWKTFEDGGLSELLDEGETATSFMLRFTLSHPDVHTAIVGTLNPEHLAQNVAAAARGPLPAEVYNRAKQLLDNAGQTPESID